MPKSALDFNNDLALFRKMGGQVSSLHKVLGDAEPQYSSDAQYDLMNRWAFKKIFESCAKEHTDIGSQTGFVAILSAICKVNFLDIRDPGLKVTNLKYVRGDITALPFEANSVKSLSCLHVAEHIGLGRYGDEIDPEGFSKACKELVRVLAPGGNLYFAVPCGIPSVQFNAHRVLGYFEVMEQFCELSLKSYAAMTSTGLFFVEADESFLEKDPYGVGMFHFVKEVARG